MKYIPKFRSYISYVVVGFICAVIGFSGGVFAKKDKKWEVKSFEDAKFVPMNPSQPEGAQWSILWGDPTTGPSVVLAKFKKGNGRLHYHTSDYHTVLLKGVVKHWVVGESEADAKPIKEGSYLYQPGNAVHGESCLTDECLLVMQWTEKKDTKFPDSK